MWNNLPPLCSCVEDSIPQLMDAVMESWLGRSGNDGLMGFCFIQSGQEVGLERAIPWCYSFLLPLLVRSMRWAPLLHYTVSIIYSASPQTTTVGKWPKTKTSHESREASPPPSFSPQEIIKVTSSPGPPIPTTSQDKSSCEHSSPGPSPSWSLFVYCPQPWHLLKGHFYIPRARLEFVILLPQPAKYWDSKCVSPYSASLF